MRKRARMLAAVTATVMMVATAGAALADNPAAGNSGHFKGSAQPCPQNQPQCPPQGG